jgi:hypothetical protein
VSGPNAEPHAAALLLRLRTVLPAGITGYDAEVETDPPQAYYVLYPDAGLRQREALHPLYGDLEMIPQITCVGVARRQAQDVADAVCAATVGHALIVAGRLCWPITQEITGAVQRDDENRDPVTRRPRFWVPVLLRIRSTTA